MKRDKRRQAVIDMLVTVRPSTLDDLADRFAVSRMTILRAGRSGAGKAEEVLMVNDGSMAALLARGLVEKRPLTLITKNAAVPDQLRDQPGITLIALGKAFSAKSNAFFGGFTEIRLSRLWADSALISTPTVLGGRAFHMDDDVVRTNRAMMNTATQSCLFDQSQPFWPVGPSSAG